jgi:hypothetical protein
MTDAEIQLARVALDLHPVGNALDQINSHLAYIRELLPKRGELVDEFNDLTAAHAYAQQAYTQADNTLTSIALKAYAAALNLPA